MAALRREDGAVADEFLGDILRLVEQATAVAAHVEDDAGEVAADLAARPVENLAQAFVRGAVEARQADQGHVAVAFVLDGRRDDAAALQRRRDFLAERRTRHGEGDGCTHLSTQLVHDVGQRAFEHRLAVDRHDHVAGLDAAAAGRRVVLHGADHGRLLGGALDGDADAAAAVALEPVVAGFFGIGVAGVAIERLGRGVHRALGQRLPVRLPQGGRGGDRNGEDLGHRRAPGTAIGRVGRRRAVDQGLAVAHHGEAGLVAHQGH